MSILSASSRVVRPRSRPVTPSWQQAMKEAVRDPATLCARLGLSPKIAERGAGAARDFPLFVPPGYLSRIRPGDPDDPLLRQVLPMEDELEVLPAFTTDPVGDREAALSPGLLRKYAGRALLVTTGACAVHCRYCFRRHFPYSDSPRSPTEWQRALDEIGADPSLTEVILSGGDPLTLTDGVLAELVERLGDIRQLRRLRIHTRLPIMIPERITEGLLELIAASRLTTVVVIHANHSQELDEQVAGAVQKLSEARIMLLNQAVLLRGVNESVETQRALCERLIELRIMPYYLHQLDRVSGAAHFEVPMEKGRQIVEELRASLPGYAVPRYVTEVPGAASKVVLL